MELQGALKKFQIEAFRSPEMKADQKVGATFYALVNPETYSVDLKMETQEGQGQGTSGKQQRFTFKLPEEFSFEFLFDNTGIIDGKPKTNITDDIQKFKDLCFKHDGDIHEPRHLKITWGTFLFKGRVTAINITYKLFNPDGSPIRANVKITIKNSEEEKERVARERNSSPDLTHKRVVKKSDTIYWMSYKIYNDPAYYLQIARKNKIHNFRKLETGSSVLFPPVDKRKT
jgi:hypothetical protein